jgi:hypothetical protein
VHDRERVAALLQIDSDPPRTRQMSYQRDLGGEPEFHVKDPSRVPFLPAEDWKCSALPFPSSNKLSPISSRKETRQPAL